jgi:hypothetical protein
MEDLGQNRRMTFKHLVGKSTLKEGITVHRGYESFFESPDYGQKQDITLLYGDSQSVRVALRRLNNVRGHVQIRYTNKTQSSFVEWLNEVFVETRQGMIGEFLEIDKISPNIFGLRPITKEMAHDAKLYVADSMYNKADQESLLHNGSFVEIEKTINGIRFKADEGQAFYNREIESAFSSLSWQKEGKAIPQLDLKYDYRKGPIQVEVEFGNARSYYQDYIKFMLSYFSKEIQLGTLITPTLGFATILCEIGKQKALQRGRKAYSGMMHFEKALREFQYLKPIFDMPIVILGIDVSPL